MSDQTQLTATQAEILKLAAYRPEGQIEPLPAQLRGGARTKVIDGLLSRDLIARQSETAPYCLTDAGYAAAGRNRPLAEPELNTEFETADPSSAIGIESACRMREHSKQATVIGMLKRPEGATITQICAVTGWQAHTVRGTFAGAFKKKLGLNLTSDRPDGRERIYRIA